jgi:hypothetical protein
MNTPAVWRRTCGEHLTPARRAAAAIPFFTEVTLPPFHSITYFYILRLSGILRLQQGGVQPVVDRQALRAPLARRGTLWIAEVDSAGDKIDAIPGELQQGTGSTGSADCKPDEELRQDRRDPR